MTMIVCVKDGRELKIEKNSIVSLMLDANGDPYKIYSGDKWACPECGFEVVAMAPFAISEHYQETFDLYEARIALTFRSD